MKTHIQVGPTLEVVRAARQAILDILKVDRETAVIIEALRAFVSVTQVHGTTIQNCTFKG